MAVKKITTSREKVKIYFPAMLCSDTITKMLIYLVSTDVPFPVFLVYYRSFAVIVCINRWLTSETTMLWLSRYPQMAALQFAPPLALLNNSQGMRFPLLSSNYRMCELLASDFDFFICQKLMKRFASSKEMKISLSRIAPHERRDK
jgi:hypothetical protein